jgi:hypothetical protein
MSEELYEQIRINFRQKDIYELLDIWRSNNRTIWSDTAFEILHEVLKERIREIPPQNDPVLGNEDLNEEVYGENDGLEEWELKLLESEGQPELYDPIQTIVLRRNVDRLIIVVIVVYVLLAILNFQPVRMYFQGVSLSINDVEITASNIVTTTLSTAIKIAFVYFPLKALSHILRILMEMEFNSRKR